MELIRKLGTKIIKDRKESFGEFLCTYCLSKVIKYLSAGKESKSCGCVTKKLQSIGNKGENNPMYGKRGEESPNFGKKASEETRNKISLGNIGKSRGLGKIKSEEHKQKIAQSKKGKKRKIFSKEWKQSIAKSKIGDKNPNWNSGSSFEEYGIEFNKELKQLILERDNYTCQCPDCEGKSTKLDTHHIDYNKKNNKPENLIILCMCCHMKTNFKRVYWLNYYQDIIINKLIGNLL